MLFIALICLALPLSTLPHPTVVRAPHVDVTHYKYITNEILVRPKRAGSFDFVGAIKNTITSHIGKASASSAAGASSSSSGSSSKSVAIEKPLVVLEKDVPFDGWQLKKSILNTIFQAVKAIAGGVTAINGQIIKGGGHILSHGGKLIAASGDAVTNVGKNIALSAKLLPAEKPVGVYKYFGSSSHSGPAAEEFTSFGGHEVVDEFVGPHDLPVYGPPLPPAPYLPPVAIDIPLDTHFQNDSPVGHTHYGPPPQYSHNPNYLDRKAEALSYDDKVDPTPLTGTDTIDSTQHKRAIEALQSLLRKLPNKLAAKDHINDIDSVEMTYGHENDIRTPLKQYNIPKDPVRIPQFKPINKSPALTSTYTFQLGPIETVTKHTIGGSEDGNSNAVLAAPNDNHSKYTFIQNPVPNYTIQTSIQSKRPYSSHSHTVNQPPLNLYHTMTLKNGHGQRQHQSQPSKLLYLPGEQQPYNIQGIQKSIEYRIQ